MNPSPQRPTTTNPQAWKAYWKAQGQLWRTEPETDTERQKYLTERRAIVPDIEKGIYPITVLAAMEAVVGLLVEISLISTVTQRFFGK